MRIGILGAGIVGTNVALEATKYFRNVTIIADKFYEDTLSHGAAGIFRPGSGFRGSEGRETTWIKDSYDYYNDILNSSEADKAGVMSVGGYIFSSRFENVTRNALLEKLLPIYRFCDKDEIESVCPNNGFQHGSFFQTMVIESGSFLPWGLQKFQASGGAIKTATITSMKELLNQYDYVINCSGLSAKFLCNDNRVVPIRGQVFKVKAPWVKMFYYGDYDTYIIPGRTTVTLGGCRNFDSWNENVDVHDSRGIFERCEQLLPNLKGASIVREWVGLRPYRDEVRVEKDLSEPNLIHCYGHGGYGITGAPGTAKNAVEILKDTLRGSGLKAKL